MNILRLIICLNRPQDASKDLESDMLRLTCNFSPDFRGNKLSNHWTTEYDPQSGQFTTTLELMLMTDLDQETATEKIKTLLRLPKNHTIDFITSIQ